MLLRCFRVDRVYRAITNFVTQRMGEKYVTPPVISFESVFEQSSPLSPIVFILSPGADPAGDLGKLAERMGFGGNRLKFLAMGQGQEKVNEYSYTHSQESKITFPLTCPSLKSCVSHYLLIFHVINNIDTNRKKLHFFATYR